MYQDRLILPGSGVDWQCDDIPPEPTRARGTVRAAAGFRAAARPGHGRGRPGRPAACHRGADRLRGRGRRRVVRGRADLGPAAGPDRLAHRDRVLPTAARALAGAGLGWLYRWCAGRFTLVGMGAPSDAGPSDPARAAGHGHTERPAAGLLATPQVEPGKGASLARAIDARRQLYGAALALAPLPLLTLALVAARPSLDPADDLLIYLVVVVATAVVGGFWPAVLAAVASSLLVNWYF